VECTNGSTNFVIVEGMCRLREPINPASLSEIFEEFTKQMMRLKCRTTSYDEQLVFRSGKSDIQSTKILHKRPDAPMWIVSDKRNYDELLVAVLVLIHRVDLDQSRFRA
jgi:hypothetical protein